MLWATANILSNTFSKTQSQVKKVAIFSGLWDDQEAPSLPETQFSDAPRSLKSRRVRV